MLNVLMFLSTFLGGAILTFASTPIFAFALYQVVYFFYPQNRWWGDMVPNLPYSFYTVVLMALGLLICFKDSFQNKLFAVPQFRWLFVILILFGVTSFYAVYPTIHNEALTNFLKLVIIMSIAYKLVLGDRELNIAIWGYIFGSWYISFMAYQLGRNAGDRVEGIGAVDSPDANGTAASIAPSLVLAFYYFWATENKLAKAALAIAGVFIANAIVLINSRGAFLGVAVSMAYFVFHMYFSKFQRKNQKATVIVLVVCGLLGASVLVDSSFIERMATITKQEVSEDKETGATRTVFWMAAWDMAKDHPMGVGVAGFQFFAPQYIDENINTGRSRNRAVHSTWFEALSELGYLGFIAFIAMMISCFSTMSKTRKVLKDKNQIDEFFKVRAIEAALIAFIISMTFINRLRADVLYWCVLYSACAYNIYVLKHFTSKSLNSFEVIEKK
ncbi:O-antigen ligase family protein [Paraglaciecola aestuariivivens]